VRFAVASIVLMLAACQAMAGGIDTGVPSRSVATPKAFWKAFMKFQYGPYDKQKKCWIGKSKDRSFCMRPNTLERVQVGGRPMVFLTANGAVIDPNNECHACPGNIGYFVLDASGPTLLVTAKGDPFLESGSYGQAPGEGAVKIRQIGPGGTYGWTQETSYTGQGVTATNMIVKAVVGDQVRSIGGALIGYNDDGNCEDGKSLTSGKACTNVTFEATFDTAAKDRFSPIVLRSTGLYEGEVFDKTFVAKFDEKSFLYVEPADLPEYLR
jgi:hypothetical protein